MKKAENLLTGIIIILGFLFLIYAISQFDIDVGRKMAKWEKQTTGYVQEIPSVKVSEGD